jgi:site-specific recombinase XerD
MRVNNALSTLELGQTILHQRPDTRPLQDFLAGQVSESTRNAYSRDIKAFFRWCRNQFGNISGFNDTEITSEEITSVTIQDVINWRNSLIETGMTPATINRKLSAIRSFFNFMKALQVIERNPSDPKLVRGLKVSQSSNTNALTVAEIHSILAVIDNLKNPVMKLRDRALILLLIYSGLRRSEAANVKQGDIVLKDAHWVLNIPEAKGGPGQRVKLQPIVVDTIQKYLDALGSITHIIEPKSTPVFIGFSNFQQGQIEPLSPSAINRIVKRHAKRAGIDKAVSAHSCRHSTASLAIAAGAQPHKVQAHLRHRSITTTMRYVHDREALESNASDFIRI